MKQPPVNLVLQTARTEIFKFIYTVKQSSNISSVVMDGIVSDVLADLRKSAMTELLNDMNQPPEQAEQDGENSE